MIFAGVCEGKTVALPKPISVEIEQELDVPCDEMTVVFPYTASFPKISRIYALNDEFADDVESAIENKEVVFAGVVDERVASVTISSAVITVYARSPAALLVDNECVPQSYYCPTAAVICEKHLKPFGIALADSMTVRCGGELNVSKGSSHYDVLADFCEKFLGTTPRIDSTGTCYWDNTMCGGELAFCASGAASRADRSVGFTSITVRENDYSRVSEVGVCSDGSLNYKTVIADDDALSSGITRTRYLNVSDFSEFSLSQADDIIAEGIRDSYVITLKTGESLVNTLGFTAAVRSEICNCGGFVVSEVHYTLTSDKQETEIKLRRA